MDNTPSTSSAPPPPFLSRIWPTLIQVLAAIGLPTAAVTYYLTRYPLLALVIFLLYELGVFIIGFLGKVWGKLEDPLAEHVATWLKQWAVILFSRYHRQYYAYLLYQHRDFDVRGLNTSGTFALELDQVFVELRIDPSTPQKAIINPVQAPPKFLEGSHTIWHYLTSAQLRQQHLVIIGPPGSGKTTLFKHVVLSLIAHHKLFHWQQHPRLRGNLPILLFLRDHAQAIHDHEQYSLISAIRDHLSKWDQPLPPEGWFERQLTKGRCLVMLDGLDEVADTETRQQVARWVERQMLRWHQNRFLVSSRPFGYRSSPLQNVTVLEVRTFTVEQVERFIRQWYLVNEIMSKQKDDPGVRMRAKSEARALLQRLRTTPALFELTVNPLLLTMIATVHRYGGELPGNRVTLYTEICEVFLGKRQLVRGQQMQFTPAQLQSVLEPLAYHMMESNTRDISAYEAKQVIEKPLEWISSRIAPEEFLRLVENISGLLLERENGFYSFAHQTFQEFLAATHLKGTQQGKLLVSHVQDFWWSETIRLYCAMEDATPVLEACLQEASPQASTIELAIDCDKEAHRVRPSVRAKLETLLKEGVEEADPERQHVIAEALLARRLKQFVHLEEETYVDTSLITCAEYQMFLDEQRAKGRYLQPDHWTSVHFPPGHGNAPVLGVRSSDAREFCAWLTERDRDSWLYRLPEGRELEQEKDIIDNRLSSGVCFWLKDGVGVIWTKEVILVPTGLVKEVTTQFFSRLLFSRNHVNQKTYANAIDLTRTGTLPGTTDLSNALAIAIDLSRDLGQGSTRTRLLITETVTRAITHELRRAFYLVNNLVRNLDRDPIRRQHALTLAGALSEILANENSLTPGLAFAQKCANTFVEDFTHGPTLTIASNLANSISLHLALVDALTSAHILVDSLTLIRTLVQDVALSLILYPDQHPDQRERPIRTQKEQLKRILLRERSRRMLTQGEVAEAIGASMRNYQRWERGENFPQEYYLRKLREFFGPSIDEVILAEKSDYGLDTVMRSSDRPLKPFSALWRLITKIGRFNQLGNNISNYGLNEHLLWTLRFFNLGSARKREQDKLQFFIDRLLDTDIDLAILQKRIKGELPACEGILIVKERK